MYPLIWIPHKRFRVSRSPRASNSLLPVISMPAGHVVGVGSQVSPWTEVVVVELQLQLVSLQVGQNEDARHRTRELPEAVVDVLRHDRHALLEVPGVDLCAAPDSRALLPGTGRVWVERSPWTELPLGESFDCGPHVGVVGWAVAREDPW